MNRTKIYGIMGKAGAGKDTAANMMIKMISKVGRGNAYRYSFADPLKEMCAYVFDIPIKCMYDQELKEREVVINIKNIVVIERMTEWVIKHIQEREKFCHVMIDPNLSGFDHDGERSLHVARSILKILGKVLCDNECDVHNKNTFKLTVRYLLQVMGTEVVRDNVDINFWGEIKKTFPDNATIIIPDCRFPNEVDYVNKHGGTVCLVHNPDLVRDDLNGHVSEKFVDEVEEYLKQKGKPIVNFKNNRSNDYQDLENQVFKFLTQDGVMVR